MMDFLSKRKVRKRILLRTKYLNLLQIVKVIIIFNKIKSYLGMASEVAFIRVYTYKRVKIDSNRLYIIFSIYTFLRKFNTLIL